ncbi:MAG TPA: acetamidase/formamidase family protein [Burkholderiales bacterium]|nr:acetamidase/formamidase family protein [Burkholderiales bacterium]
MAKNISIDRTKRLREEPHKGHNRWHPDIPPVIEVEPGEEVTLETRDAMDLQIGPRTTVKDLEKMERTVAHPLTGPVYVKGAKPGDLLEIEHLDIVPERYGWTRFSPGFGFLPDLFDRYFVVHWDITPEYATSPQLPGVRIPNGAFMGTAGLAPSREQLRIWSEREKQLADRGGKVMLPTAAAAVPSQGPVAEEGLRTIPPRENCGNA